MEVHVKFTAVFEPATESGYAVYVEEIPGVNTRVKRWKKPAKTCEKPWS